MEVSLALAVITLTAIAQCVNKDTIFQRMNQSAVSGSWVLVQTTSLFFNALLLSYIISLSRWGGETGWWIIS